uniref:Calpain-15 n=1 Tax=Acrobeloides nanus TaxID=290746 RepID=A0A914BXG3_9BILA
MEWSCKYCTFINNQWDPLCKACGAEGPYSRAYEKKSILPRLKLPTSVSSTITSAVAAVDNAIGMISDEFRNVSTTSPRTTTFHPMPRPSSRNVLTESNEWCCPRCTTKNLSSQKFCVSCNFSKFDDPKSSYWTCTKCFLSQPLPPINSKCPLCREKVSKLLKKNLASSLPQLHVLAAASSSAQSTENFQENDAEAKEIFDNIIQFCKQYKQSFLDDGFPHSNRSIGDFSSLENKNMKIVWLRPQQIYTKDGFSYKWTVFNNPQPTDIEQGVLGNCWFISALAVIAERPEILEKIVLTKTYNSHGAYQIRLCADGLWQTVVVDDFFPCEARSKSMAFAVGRKNQLWVPLIEKALAKIYGNYIALRAGRSIEGLATLTGAPCQHIDLEVEDPAQLDLIWVQLLSARFISALAVIAERPEILEKIVLTKTYNSHGVYQIRLCADGLWQTVVVDDFFPCEARSKSMAFAVGRKNQLWVPLIEKALAKIYGNYIALRAGRSIEGLATLTGAPCQHIDLEVEDPAQLDLIWVQLLSAREANFLMGCSCGAGRRPINDSEYKRLGLMSCHAYSILDVRQFDNHRLVRLRNPWGGFVWQGEWGATDPRVRQFFGSSGNEAGTFWIPFDQFVKYFDSVDIAQLRLNPAWHTKRYALDLGWEEHATKVVKFSVTKPTEMCFTLFQRGARTVLDLCDIMLLVHREDPSTGNPGELIIRTPRRCSPSVRTDDIFLQAGNYMICAISFAHFADLKQLPATIVIHSAKSVVSEMISAPMDVLCQSIISLMLKEAVPKEQVPGEIVRFLSHDIGGLMVMVDNLNTDKCVQVKADCQNSINILSSRCELATIDSIPPLHRQILLVLTHFEPSQMYIVEHHLTQRLYPRAQLADFAPQSPAVHKAFEKGEILTFLL